MSLNQNDIDKTRDVRLKIKLFPAWAKPWNDKTADVVRLSKLMDVYKGHGEGDTKWKGCDWKLLLFKFNIISFISLHNSSFFYNQSPKI